MSEDRKKPDLPRDRARPSMDALKAASDQAVAAFVCDRSNTECALDAVEKFTAWAKLVSARDNDRTEVEAAYARIEDILGKSIGSNPIMHALYAKLMAANRYCKRVAKELIPESDIRRTLELALRDAARCEVDIRKEVLRIANSVKGVLAPQDGPPDASFSGECDVPETEEAPSPRRVIDISDDEEEIPGDALRTPGKFDN